MDVLSGMAVFARVVEAGGFSAAARVSGLSKGAVSKQVSRLEDRLGVRLLTRTTRRLALTDAGAAFYERCRRVLAEAEEAEAEAAELQAEPRGRLKVNAPLSFGVRHLGPILPDFMEMHPALSVDLVLEDRMVDLVQEGYDVALRIAALPDSTLIARRICASRRILCAAPSYLDRFGRPRNPGELAAHQGLLYSYMTSGEEWVLQGPNGPVSLRMRGRLRANNGDVLRCAALAGQGITLMPTFLAGEDMRAGRLERVLPELEDTSAAVYVVHAHVRHVPAKVRAFTAFLLERFSPVPPWDDGRGG